MESDEFAEFAKPPTYSRSREIIRRGFIVFWSPEVPRRNSPSWKVRGESAIIPAEGEEALGFCSTTKPIPAHCASLRNNSGRELQFKSRIVAHEAEQHSLTRSRSSRSLRIISSPPSIPNGALTFVSIYELIVVRAERCKGQPEAPADLMGRP